MDVRDRVVELRRVRASELRANPKNWRRHPSAQASALRSVLEKVGFAGALLARETPDGLELIDGHLRKEISGRESVPVLVLDVDAEEADLILATLDPIGAMAAVDEEALLALLQQVVVPDPELAEMLANLEEPDPDREWTGMPAFDQDDRQSAFSTTVHFATDEDMAAFFREIGRPRSFSFWWPEHDGFVGSTVKQRWVAEDAES